MVNSMTLWDSLELVENQDAKYQFIGDMQTEVIIP